MIDDPEIPPVGVIPLDDRTARWRVWAPKAKRVELVLGLGTEATRVAMEAEPRGYHVATTPRPEPGARYAYALDGGPPRPDPLSRWQPGGIDAPSAVWFPERSPWGDEGWAGHDRRDLVFYELHVGTFTPEGTFDAVIPRLAELRDLGITAVELMPVAQFPGARGWGYDGVHPFAPQHSYGGPEGLRRLVEACHAEGLSIVLDVVYNHFGPAGNHFPEFGHYLNPRYQTDWGPALNYDGKHADPVRAMVLENARYWIRDYHFDGLRLDAADQIFDVGPMHLLAEVAEVVHREGGRAGRRVHVFAETDLNHAQRFLGERDRGGFGHDGHWNDDFHHAAHVLLTGDDTGYFIDFADGPAAMAKVYQHVYVNNGTYSPFRDRRHGAPADEFPGDRFLSFIQNHDQVANGSAGKRIAEVLPPSAARLAAGLLLLAPRLPLLFMGEEYGETNRFPYFCDYDDPQMIEAVRKGRAAEFAYFGREEEPPDPVAPETVAAAVLSWSWADPTRSGLRHLYRTLLRLRRKSEALRDFRYGPARLLDAPGCPRALLEAVRGLDPGRSVRLLFNLTAQAQPRPADLAALAPAFRSEVPEFGAPGVPTEDDAATLRPHEFQVIGPLEGL